MSRLHCLARACKLSRMRLEALPCAQTFAPGDLPRHLILRCLIELRRIPIEAEALGTLLHRCADDLIPAESGAIVRIARVAPHFGAEGVSLGQRHFRERLIRRPVCTEPERRVVFAGLLLARSALRPRDSVQKRAPADAARRWGTAARRPGRAPAAPGTARRRVRGRFLAVKIREGLIPPAAPSPASGPRWPASRPSAAGVVGRGDESAAAPSVPALPQRPVRVFQFLV